MLKIIQRCPSRRQRRRELSLRFAWRITEQQQGSRKVWDRGQKLQLLPAAKGPRGGALPGAHGNQAQKSSGPPSYSARTPFGFFRLRAAGGSRGLMGSSFDDDDDEQQQQQGTWVGGWLGGWVLSGLQTGVFLIKNKFRFSK